MPVRPPNPLGTYWHVSLTTSRICEAAEGMSSRSFYRLAKILPDVIQGTKPVRSSFARPERCVHRCERAQRCWRTTSAPRRFTDSLFTIKRTTAIVVLSDYINFLMQDEDLLFAAACFEFFTQGFEVAPGTAPPPREYYDESVEVHFEGLATATYAAEE
jgi:hypothetical protein